MQTASYPSFPLLISETEVKHQSAWARVSQMSNYNPAWVWFPRGRHFHARNLCLSFLTQMLLREKKGAYGLPARENSDNKPPNLGPQC